MKLLLFWVILLFILFISLFCSSSLAKRRAGEKNREIKMLRLLLWYGSFFDKSMSEYAFNGIEYH